MARTKSQHPTELELEILKVLWDESPLTVREVRVRLESRACAQHRDNGAEHHVRERIPQTKERREVVSIFSQGHKGPRDWRHDGRFTFPSIQWFSVGHGSESFGNSRSRRR